MTAIATGERRESEAAARRPAAPIDLVHLARQTFGSVALEREVLALFVAQARGLVGAIARGTGAERAASLHRLKGSARGVGAMRIGALAEALEAPELGEAEAARLVEALIAAEAETRAFVNGLDGGPARDVAGQGGASAT